ncbi:MAG: FHA domain-containing protein [Anaerolineae bacterium]|nr:FHA domain-containing protein [Anaerolineae bacterium]
MNVTGSDSSHRCPSCSRQVSDSADVCPYCGYDFLADSTLVLDESESQELLGGRLGTARFNQKMRLVMRLGSGGAEFSFDPAQIDTLVLGRRDPASGETPQVDLADHNAESLGVSRRHAVIKRGESNALSLLDQDSVNGTFLNGQRLIPDQPRILRDGDEIRLGRLAIAVYFIPVR